MPLVQILLASYNGEAFIREQLQSLLLQTFTDIEVLVADDGSTDATLDIVEALARDHPNRVRIVFRSRIGGAARNFMRLVELAEADYVMCCDQDDVWMPDKIEAMLAVCRALEGDVGPGTPVLVHSDLVVVDASLQEIDPSLFGFLRIDPSRCRFKDLLLQNCVTGCAMLMNRALTQRVKGSDPDAMIMHDWWISLVAASFGLIKVLRRPTVLYRQHGGNVLGASRPGLSYFAGRVMQVTRGGRLNQPVRRCFGQAAAFMERYGQALRPDDQRPGRFIASLASQSPLRLRYLLLRHRVLKQGLFRNALTLLTV